MDILLFLLQFNIILERKCPWLWQHAFKAESTEVTLEITPSGISPGHIQIAVLPLRLPQMHPRKSAYRARDVQRLGDRDKMAKVTELNFAQILYWSSNFRTFWCQSST